jgi:sugar/nucleoside kinase (ribokinase family)
VEEVCAPILEQADLLLPSGAELTTITGISDDEQAVQALLDRGIRMVILKHGRDGSTLHSAEGRLHASTTPREEVDPTGAGDVFAAGVAYGLLHGLPPARMLAIANAVGGLAVTRLGPMEGAPSLTEALAQVS